MLIKSENSCNSNKEKQIKISFEELNRDEKVEKLIAFWSEKTIFLEKNKINFYSKIYSVFSQMKIGWFSQRKLQEISSFKLN